MVIRISFSWYRAGPFHMGIVCPVSGTKGKVGEVRELKLFLSKISDILRWHILGWHVLNPISLFCFLLWLIKIYHYYYYY